MNLFIFGNGNLSFGDFVIHYVRVLEGIKLSKRDTYLVCDFRGADTLVMEYLKHVSARVSVFHIGEQPRYLPDRYRTKVSGWELVGGFSSDNARDDAAIDACTHFLAHDTNSTPERRSGTGRNIERCLALGKTRLGFSSGSGELAEPTCGIAIDRECPSAVRT